MWLWRVSVAASKVELWGVRLVWPEWCWAEWRAAADRWKRSDGWMA